MLHRRGLRRRVWLAAVAAFALVAIAPQTGGSSITPVGCQDAFLEQPFLPWLDPAYYTLVPNGGFENGSADWTLTGGATVAAGNESYFVRAPSDSQSLSLVGPSSAKTTAVCVAALDGTLRLFVRNLGAPLSTLAVDVIYRNVTGGSTLVTVANLTGTAKWAPTRPIAVLANLEAPPLVSDGSVSVAFRFRSGGGAWAIDDVYVDPFKGV